MSCEQINATVNIMKYKNLTEEEEEQMTKKYLLKLDISYKLIL